MKKKYSVLFISLLMAILCVCLVACNDADESLSRDYTYNDVYSAYEITNAEIRQNTLSSCDYVITCDIAPSASAKVYISRYDYVKATDTAIDYTANDGKYCFSNEIKSDYYFIHIVDGEKHAVLPLAHPQMAPSASSVQTSDRKSVEVNYNFVPKTSWSSFCDPTGKSVFKSATSTFDASTATVLKQNVKIDDTSPAVDYSPSDEAPYYFVVLSSKNGIVKYISKAFVTLDNMYSNLTVSIEEVNNVASLVLSGTFITDGEIAIGLHSDNSVLDSPVDVYGERVSGLANSTFKATLDITQIISNSGEGVWFDIKISTTSGGVFDATPDNADMMQELLSGDVKFEFQAYGDDLKLNYVKGVYSAVNSVSIDTTGVPTLIVKGNTASNVTDIKIHANTDNNGTNAGEKLWDNQSSESGKFEFRIALSELPTIDGATPWSWFHVYTYIGSEKTSADLNRGKTLSVDDYFDYNGVRYTIKAWSDNGSYGKGLAIQTEKI